MGAIDWPLVGVALLFFGLSFLMARLVDRLPVWCQTSWFLVAVWGIFWINFAYGVIHPEAWGHIRNLAIIFLAALPGMMALDHLQKKSRVSYWEREGIPPEAQGRIIYLSELIDRFVEWWLWLRIKHELKDLSIPEPDNSDSDCRIHDGPGNHR